MGKYKNESERVKVRVGIISLESMIFALTSTMSLFSRQLSSGHVFRKKGCCYNNLAGPSEKKKILSKLKKSFFF